jgi:hypothetical protein
MKKIIIAIMLLASLKASSQKVDTTIKRCIAARIDNIIYSNGIPPNVDTIKYLGIFDYQDDLKGNCVVNWVLLNENKNIVWNNYKLTKEEYDGWDGYAVGLLSILGTYLKLKFK